MNAGISRTVWLTAVAMIAFAANSLLCRMALGQHRIDAASFTSVRILSGTVMLAALIAIRDRGWRPGRPDLTAVASLFCYMICFSFAYLTLSAATGALLLFGAVQLTMFTAAIRSGERFSTIAWVGLVLAFTGLVYLLSPGVAAPDLSGAALMIAAGVGWGAYSLIGRGVIDPLGQTGSNFLYAAPLAVAASITFSGSVEVSREGIVLAVASGALASGAGYAIWYAALTGLTAGRAATVQLSVPIIAAAGGVMLLGEDVSLRLSIASALTIGGIWLVLGQRTRQKEATTEST